MEMKEKTVGELMNLYFQILSELKDRGVVRTYNSPVGDYAEWLVSQKMGLQLQKNSKKGYDACDEEEKVKYQIKSRWERGNPSIQSRELSVIRNYEEKDFDFLIVLIFDIAFRVKEAYSIPHEVIKQYASYRKHVNGYILIAKGEVLQHPLVEDITEKFK